MRVWSLSQECKAGSVFKKTINIIRYLNNLKRKIHIIISVNAEKAFDEIQHPLMIKTPSKLRIEGNFLTLKKDS